MQSPCRGHRVISIEIKGDRTKLHPVEGAPRDREDNIREFNIRDTAYASHIVREGDLINPEPIEGTWLGEWRCDGWSKALENNEQTWSCTRGRCHVVLRIPTPLQSEINFNRWLFLNNLEHPTQMHQKIANVLKRKVDSLHSQDDREQNKRVLVVVFAILLLSFVRQMYLNSASLDQ